MRSTVSPPASSSDLQPAYVCVANNGPQRLLTLLRSRETSDSKTLILNISRNLDSLSDGRPRFAQPISTKFFIIFTWNFDVNVNTVEHGPEMRLWYLVKIAGTQVQAFCESP
jgi:hypothetical protein